MSCERASTIETLHELFGFRFTEAVHGSGEKFDCADLTTNVDAFKADVLASIGDDLQGFQLDHFEIRFPGLR